jgi:hypothetical protein
MLRESLALYDKKSGDNCPYPDCGGVLALLGGN